MNIRPRHEMREPIPNSGIKDLANDEWWNSIVGINGLVSDLIFKLLLF